MSDNKDRIRFLNSYSGMRLLSQHFLDETGIWKIEGEDPSPGLAGDHSRPLLGYRDGKLSDVIDEAVNMRGFWTWGIGGTITNVNVVAPKTCIQEKVEVTLRLSINRPSDISLKDFLSEDVFTTNEDQIQIMEVVEVNPIEDAGGR